MSTTLGNKAEHAAAAYLQSIGHEIVSRNWRTRVCEIDIVTKKAHRLHFVEVKYRSSNNQGSGIDYITPKKLHQMEFAAQCYVEEEKWQGDYSLDAIEVGGDFIVTEYLESVS